MKKRWLAIGCMASMILFSSCSTFGFSSKENSTLTITAPEGEVIPYTDVARQYLEVGAGANVKDFYVGNDEAYKAVKIVWNCDASSVAEYRVEYATKEDYSDAISVTCKGDETSLSVYNLYKGTKYYVRVTAYNEAGKKLSSDEGTFETTKLGPRVMKIDGICNVRDLGGYQTAAGKTTAQGLLYRGGALTPGGGYDTQLTVEGKACMSKQLGIKTEIDFRTKEEAGQLTESQIPNAKLLHIVVGGYADAFHNYASAYRQVFSVFAVKENYPIYYHCTGGADRTGTVSFLLNALLGVSEEVCVQDYEFTTFSLYGMRNVQEGDYVKYYQPFRTYLDSYEGDTLQEKAETYFLSIGLTKNEIQSIQAIMLGEK